jgi:ribose/xylose/arabinose/galactoside ABC-type transport system permease subunit
VNTEASRLATRTRIVRFARHNGIFVALLVLLTFMLLTKPQFGTAQNLSNILQQNAVIGVLACGMTFAIVIGGFDLSVGSTAALSTVVTATLFASGRAIALPLGLAGALVAGLLVGTVNGWLIAYVRVNPFVATLGTMTIVRGTVYVITNATPVFGVPINYTSFGLGKLFGIPNVTWIFALVGVLLGAVLHLTRFGHYVYTIGGNAHAAKVMGVDTRRVRFLTYLLVSCSAAIAGVLLVVQTASGQPAAATGYELTAIAAVIVGGATLGGGHGRMIGTIVGVLLLGVVTNGLNLFGVSPFWQPIATGLILILAVGLDRARSDAD